jgi:hypothetical protein
MLPTCGSHLSGGERERGRVPIRGPGGPFRLGQTGLLRSKPFSLFFLLSFILLCFSSSFISFAI